MKDAFTLLCRSSRKSSSRRRFTRSRSGGCEGRRASNDRAVSMEHDDDNYDEEDDDSDVGDSNECCSAHCGRHSQCDSEEANSPKESCYSFVRRALQVASPDTPQTQEQVDAKVLHLVLQFWIRPFAVCLRLSPFLSCPRFRHFLTRFYSHLFFYVFHPPS